MLTTLAIAFMTRLTAVPISAIDDDAYEVRHLAGPKPSTAERMRLPLGRAYRERARWAGLTIATR